MVKNECILYLDKSQYMGGEVVSGAIRVILGSAIKSKGVRVQLIGEEIAGWRGGTRGEQPKPENKSVSERKYFFKVERTLWGHQRSDRMALPKVLEAGDHKFTFEYQLPDQIPCSFKHNNGSITYTVRGYAEKGKKKVIKSITETIIVFGSATPALLRQMRPITTENQGRVRFSRATLLVQATLDRRVQFLGEDCKVVVEGVNESNKTLDQITIELRQKLVFTAQRRRLAPEAAMLSSTAYRRLKIKASSTYRHELTFSIPKKNITPSVVHSNALVSALYFFRVILVVPYGTNVEVILPVTIVSPYLKRVLGPDLASPVPQPAAGAPPPPAAGPSGRRASVAPNALQIPDLTVDRVRCVVCGHQNPLDGVFCERDGQILPAEILPPLTPPLNICTQCQSENEPSAFSCVACGSQLPTPAAGFTSVTAVRASTLSDRLLDLAHLVPSHRFNMALY